MSLALAPFSILYGALARSRAGLYRSGFLKTERVGAPVISVGNLTAGGTGKTPLVEWAARALAAEGLRACVLTRGYGRADESRRAMDALTDALAELTVNKERMAQCANDHWSQASTIVGWLVNAFPTLFGCQHVIAATLTK